MKNLKMFLDKKRETEAAAEALILQQTEKELHLKWEDQQVLVKIQVWEECLVKVQFQMMVEKCLLQVFQEVHPKDKIQDKVHLKMVSTDQVLVHKVTLASRECHQWLKEQVIYLEEIL